MPHFVIDCSENILSLQTPETILDAVYDTANSTGLFKEGDVKVRINPFKYYKLGPGKESFIHVFANIMEGRNTEQKIDLSKKIVAKLNELFPAVPFISVNVSDFEKATYFNKSML